MRSSSKCCGIITVIGLILGFIVFMLFYSGIICIGGNYLFFILVIIVAIAALLTLLKTSMFAERTPAFREAYCCCGNISAIGGAATIIIALFSSLLGPIGGNFLLAAAMGLIFLFLVLQFGGLWCLLYMYNGCRRECCPRQDPCGCNQQRDDSCCR